MVLNKTHHYFLLHKLSLVLLGAVLAFVAGLYYTTTNQAYTKELEKVLAQCLSDATGKPIVIGNEIYLCSIYRIGERVGHYPTYIGE